MFPVDAERVETVIDGETLTPTFAFPRNITPADVGKVLVLAWRSGGAISAVTDQDGFSELLYSTADASDDRLYVGYRVVDGTEGASATFTMTGTSRKYSAACWLIEDGGVPELTAADGSGSSVNPPGHTPSGGPGDYLVLAIGSNEDTRTVTGTPANYDNLVSATSTSGTGTARCTIFGMSRQVSIATSEDPDTFTVNNTTQWMAATVAIPFSADPEWRFTPRAVMIST